MTPTEVRTHIRFNRYERKACRQGGSTILDHMTTADTARDMDLIRQAVGEDQLSYYGISYGTYLGATYARLFPHQVRALIVDGVLDPVAWSTGRNGSGTVIPFSTRLGSGRGAADAMLSALALCDQVGQERCAFAGNARHKWRQLTNRLRKEPLEFPDGSTLAYADLIDGVLGGLYSSSDYRFLMRDLQRLWTRTNPPTKAVVADDEIRAVRDRLVQRERRLPYGYGLPFFPSFEGVACSDTLNPSDPAAWQRAADRSEATQPWFGRLWTWVSAACPNWPGSAADAFRGPWHGTTANPVLLVGNAHDPATPFSGAAALHQLLDGSRLFRLDGWGHGALGESRCVTKVFDAYLVQGTLPAVGTVCEPDDLLFPVRHST
jgi:pimeloyl-ACP methyl ester carboxylesterase